MRNIQKQQKKHLKLNEKNSNNEVDLLVRKHLSGLHKSPATFRVTRLYLK